MREIGGDPLEAYGGIYTIAKHRPTGDYPSELGNNGRVGWTRSTTTNGKVAVLVSSISNSFLQVPYGWSILLWQGWAVGEFEVDTDGRFILQCTNTKMVAIDEPSNFYAGDWYGYGSLLQVVQLTKGKHTMYVQLESSIREFGNTPNISFSCQFSSIESPLISLSNFAIQPSVVNMKLTSNSFSIPVLATQDWTRSVQVTSMTTGVSVKSPIMTIAPGQTSLISFDIYPSNIVCPLNFTVCITDSTVCHAKESFSLPCTTFGSEPYGFTFHDYDGSLQAAYVTPPKKKCSASKSKKCTVMVATHGAGVDAGNPFWTKSIDQQDFSWILFPTGRRPWGYDWHGPSYNNIINALKFLNKHLPGVPNQLGNDYLIDTTKILWTGHSMGGAGCWFLSSHYPDLALGAACVAGFISIEKYVPFYLRLSHSYIDPVFKGVLDSAIAQYDSDLYMGNLVGIPVLARYGSDDNNVPPWNSRRNARVLMEWTRDPNSVEISEVAGAGHWWDTAMNGPEIQNFYLKHAFSDLPDFPSKFVVSTLNPDSSGSRGSFKIVQLETPFQMSKLMVEITNNKWEVETINVKRFGILLDERGPKSTDSITIDNQSTLPIKYMPDSHYCQDTNGNWLLCTDANWSNGERRPGQYGTVDSILEKHFVIVYGTQGSNQATSSLLHHSIQFANQWYLYSNANVTIVSDSDEMNNLSYDKSYILLGGPDINAVTAKFQNDLPVKFSGSTFTIGKLTFKNQSNGVIFLAPHGTTQLKLVVAGVDLDGILLAAKCLPVFTGTTIPDYYVVGESFLWRAAGGALAAGYWDNFWKLSI